MSETDQKNQELPLAVTQPPVVDVEQLNQDLPDEYIAGKLEDEEKVGGVGSVYNVPESSYAAFRKAVLGHGYDIDNYYGWQCWDGAALLWQQFGLSLLTGNGLAIGCWDLKRTYNKGTRFDLVTSVNSLKPGDVVVMRPNHIGFFDGYDGGYMRILGQNQGGTPGKNGGSAFNVVRITKGAFAGAFRLKAWHKPKPAPKPPTSSGYKVVKTINGYINAADAKARRNPRVKVAAGTYKIFNKASGMLNVTKKAGVPGSWINPADNKAAAKKPARKSNETIAREVIAGKWGVGSARKRKLTQAGYNYATIQAIVNRLVK